MHRKVLRNIGRILDKAKKENVGLYRSMEQKLLKVNRELEVWERLFRE